MRSVHAGVRSFSLGRSSATAVYGADFRAKIREGIIPPCSDKGRRTASSEPGAVGRARAPAPLRPGLQDMGHRVALCRACVPPLRRLPMAQHRAYEHNRMSWPVDSPEHAPAWKAGVAAHMTA